jgi:hypothetical protein
VVSREVFVIHWWRPDCAVVTPVLYNGHPIFESSSLLIADKGISVVKPSLNDGFKAIQAHLISNDKLFHTDICFGRPPNLISQQ